MADVLTLRHLAWLILLVGFASACRAPEANAGRPEAPEPPPPAAPSGAASAEAPTPAVSDESESSDPDLRRALAPRPALFAPGPKDCWSVDDVVGSGDEQRLEFDDPDCDPELERAVSECDVASIRSALSSNSPLSSNGASALRCRTEAGRTLLHLVPEDCAPALPRALIEAGTEVSVCDPRGVAPIHQAAESGAVEYLESLLGAGAFANAVALNGDRPLHFALARRKLMVNPPPEDHERYLTVISLLLQHGADPNAPDRTGDTPLHEGVYYLDVVRTLVEHGAALDATGAEGLTPLELAEDEVREYLLRESERANEAIR